MHCMNLSLSLSLLNTIYVHVCAGIRRNRPNSRVQFTVDTNLDTGLIHLERIEDVIEAHIGLLKNHHTYSVEIPITHSLGESVCLSVSCYAEYDVVHLSSLEV